jgi:hypothetical protein
LNAQLKAMWRRAAGLVRDAIRWGDCHIPRGLRSVSGVLLICGGVVGFLPILGFWMVPAGLAMIALDIPAWRARVLDWCDRDGDRAGPGQ